MVGLGLASYFRKVFKRRRTERSRDDWRRVFWREWRFCDSTPIAGDLYAAVSDTPVSSDALVPTARLCGVLGVWAGAATGAVVGLAVGHETTVGLPVWLACTFVGVAGGAIGGVLLALRTRWMARGWRKLLRTAWPLLGTAPLRHSWLALLAGAAAAGVGSIAVNALTPIQEEPSWWMLPATGFLIGSLIVALIGLADPPLTIRTRGGLRKNLEPDRRRCFVWWSPRPSLLELREACADPDAPDWVRDYAREAPEGEPPTNEELLRALASDELQARLDAAYWYARMEGRGVLRLAEYARSGGSAREAAEVLAQDIGARTLARMSAQPGELLCVDCLLRMATRTESLSLQSAVEWWGCRACGNSSRTLAHAGPVVAVVDSSADWDLERHHEDLYVNWHTRAAPSRFETVELFDFDRVLIASATDDEVRHFLVDLESDTDKARRARYGSMRCDVLRGCTLSANTVRALESVFGEVGTVDVEEAADPAQVESAHTSRRSRDRSPMPEVVVEEA